MPSLKHIPESRKDIDGSAFYLGSIDPEATFNRIEITLSHIFRKKHPSLLGRNYSDCLFEYLKKTNYFRPSIIEIGGGLGDLAYNYLSGVPRSEIDSYIMYDISPGLLDRQRSKLKHLATDFICSDALELSTKISSFQGLLLSNGMIADLRSVFVSSDDPLRKYGIDDVDLADFVQTLGANEEGRYLHVGAILFLREIATVLRPGGTVAILEYKSTGLNQPSMFGDHFECGIDFSQIRAYAGRLGFLTELVDIDTILGLPPGQQFLTMDFFANQDRFARLCPEAVKLWGTKSYLPVLAYTRDSLRNTLVSEPFAFDPADADHMLAALEQHFHSIHEERFDTKNPTTWSYHCLLLEKQFVHDWKAISEEVAVPAIAKLAGVSTETARDRWYLWSGEATMGLGTVIFEAIIGGLAYQLVQFYGKKVWRYMLLPALKARLEKLQVSRKDMKKVIDAVRSALGN